MKGFTLIEVLVVMGITVIFTGLLVTNFSRTRVDLNQTTLLVKDAIREAQSKALSGALFGTPGASRCGYGIHFTADAYTIYAGPISSVPACIPANYGYIGGSPIVRQAFLPSSAINIVPPADIFFEPPDPKTYIGGLNTPGLTATINIRKETASCPSADCRQINVTTSGQIQ